MKLKVLVSTAGQPAEVSGLPSLRPRALLPPSSKSYSPQGGATDCEASTLARQRVLCNRARTILDNLDTLMGELRDCYAIRDGELGSKTAVRRDGWSS